MGLPLETTIGRLTGYPHHCKQPPLYRKDAPPLYRVCLYCLIEPITHRFYTGEFLNESYHCEIHGAITPKWSAVKNEPRTEPKKEVCEYCGQPMDRHFVGCSRPRTLRAEQAIDWSAA